jgi:hypothetical protein
MDGIFVLLLYQYFRIPLLPISRQLNHLVESSKKIQALPEFQVGEFELNK